jgi:prepilin-type N-terminal cleavage/methylation domain-containing protein
MGMNARPDLRRGTGFTLVEVLLVLALLALIGMVLLPVAGGLMPKAGGGGWEDNVAETLQRVRREAVVSGRELTMRFDPETRCLVWPGGASEPLGSGDAKPSVDFLRSTGTSAVLIGGQLVETTVIPVLRFYPDGTCDPVRIQLRATGSPPRVLSVDPWTCAPGLEVKK